MRKQALLVLKWGMHKAGYKTKLSIEEWQTLEKNAANYSQCKKLLTKVNQLENELEVKDVSLQAMTKRVRDLEEKLKEKDAKVKGLETQVQELKGKKYIFNGGVAR